MYPGFFLQTVIFSTFIFFIFIGVECSTYLGCYREKSINDRLFKGDHVDFHNTLTKSKCLSHCSGKGFTYIGLQYKYECFCSNEKPSQTFSTDDEECDMKCDGNSTEICGGGLKLSVYSVGGQQYSKYIGCYKERSIEARLMSEEQRDFQTTLTPQICINHCKNKGFTYAGLQYNFQCFCSNTRPLFKWSADEGDCNSPCDGDENQVCGGGYRLSVYETTEIVTNFVEYNYIGCYTETNANRALNSAFGSFPDTLIPEFCVGYCYRRGYRFAGLQNGTECYCGDSIKPELKIHDSECNRKCPGNSRFTCGAPWKNSVYHTQISDYSEEWKVVGCFIDKEDLRVLSAASTTFHDTNTPKLCLNVCLQFGYKFSGVEYGVECFCGNRKPERDREVSENQCAMPCPGDRTKHCGGNWRILVYSTNVVDNKASTVSRPQTPQRTTSKPSQQQTNQRPSQGQSTTAHTPMMSTTNNNINTKKPKPSCVQSLTEVNRQLVCKDEMLFKEDFVNDISNDKWTYEVKMPWIPDYEFVVLQKKAQNVYVSNGKLHIKPTMQEDNFVRRGRLELIGCTGMVYSDECIRQAATYSILPPIESARITTKDSFSFKYGVIQIRAKLPKGDWIVPEIWLEPKRNVYGPSYASGRIRIAMARGNKNLLIGDQDIGNRILESGVLMGVGENIRGRTIIRDKVDGWHKNFHNYTLIWTPDNLQFLVDGEHQESIMTPGATLAELVQFDQNTAVTWKPGTKIAPFDQEFYLSLGVAVGGMRDFPDESISDGNIKPWKNMAVKAMLNFWLDRDHWKTTWDDIRSALQVEHVRIKAL